MKKIILTLISFISFSFSAIPHVLWDEPTCPTGKIDIYNLVGVSLGNSNYNCYDGSTSTGRSCLLSAGVPYSPSGIYYSGSYYNSTYNYTYVFSSASCQALPTCPANEIYDTSTSICVCNAGYSRDVNGTCVQNPPLDCPVNSSPDANNTFCVCNSPYALRDMPDGTRSCQLSPQLPDSNSTNTDGSCKAGFAKNINGICKIDTDNDGFPDVEDYFPNDSTKHTQTGSSSNNPTDVNYCNLDVTSCADCKCPVGTRDFGAIQTMSDGTVNIRVCGNGFTPIFCSKPVTTTSPTNDCNEGYVPAPDYAVTANCIPKQQECNYPPFSYGTNYPFQIMGNDVFTCIDLQNSYGDGNYDTYNCPDGRVACYYNLKSKTQTTNTDTNTTTSGTITDTNTTNTTAGGNTTVPFDGTKIVNALDSIKSQLDVNSPINNNLIGINNIIKDSSNKNHIDLQNLQGTLTSKLDAINNSIQNIPQPQATDMTATNQKLDAIKGALNPVLDGVDTSGQESKLNGVKDALNNTLTSFKTTYNDMVGLFNGAHTSQVHASGSCHLGISLVKLGNIDIDFSKLSILRAPLQFFLNLLLLFMTIKLYSAIARDLARYFIGA